MKKTQIVDYWLHGYSQDWLAKQQYEDIIFSDRCKDMKKPEIKKQAKLDIEEALIEWWREQANAKGNTN
jgi:uncharacterized protein (DUF924 family)